MSKSVELLAGSEDVEPISDQTRAEERSGLNLNGSRQISKSATELRENNDASAKSSIDRHRPVDHPSVVHRHHRHTSVAQRTHTFFATLKSRWSRSRSKERKKSRDSFGVANQDSFGNQAVESDYAGDYSSEHSKSSSATQSPARHCLNHPESPLARGSKEKAVALQEDSPGKSKGSLGFQGQRDGNSEDQPKVQRRYSRNDPTTALLQDEASRRRELALRQHAFFQLRLHIRRGANLVAMDRCGASDPYVKIKSSGRLLHKSRTVHRDLNPVWDESVTLPIEDAFQPLTIKVFDYDWGLQDDFMGAAQLDLTQLELGHPQDIILELKDPARPRQHLGEIFLTATLWPRNQQDKEQMEGDITEENQNLKASNNVSECRYDRSSRQLEDQKSMCSREIICEDAKPSEKESWVSGEDSSKEEKGAEEDCISIEEENAKIVHEVGEIESTKHSREDHARKGLAPEDEANSISRKNSLKNTDHLEISKTKYEGICDMGDSSELIFRANESSSEKSAARVKEKMSVGSLRLMLEKRVETVERLLEENVEKYPWLQPIETWIVDHRRSSPPSVLYEPLDRRGYDSDGEVKSKFREKRSGSPKIECKISKVGQESKSECKMMDHLKRLRRGGSPKPDRGQVFEKNVENASKVERAVIDCFKGFRKVGFSKDEDKMDVSEEKIDPSTSYPGNKSFLHPYDAKSRICPEISDSSKNPNDLRRSSSPSFDVDPRETFEMKQQGQDFLEKLKEGFKEKKEELYRYFQRTSRLADVNRKLKSQIWSSVVTIVLVEAKNLLPMDIEGLSDPYVKFRLGTEKYKSKVINKTLNPIWLEQFDLHLYEDPYLGQELEMTVWDRDKSHQDNLMGRAIIDLAILERETTHRLWRDLEDGAGSIFLLLTISGTTANETISDLAAHEETPQERARLDQRYSFANTLQRPRDVGHLTVKVYRAQGLVAADLGGKSDPFCVLELVNARLQTQTEYKTLAPNWQKIFTFNVKDINSVLEVTVYDEDRDHKVEFLGKVAIPLLRIRNGEKRWYALKDKKLRGRAKGNSPQILLEMTVVWNVLRACIRTLNPREKKYMEPEMKFKRQVFLRNVLRLKAIIVFFIDMGKYVQSCWEWESKTRSIVALVLFVLGCYYFEPFMIPAAALLILFRYYVVAVVTGVPLSYQSNVNLQELTDLPFDDCPPTPGDDDDDEDDKDKEEKKSLKERLQAIQEVTQTVQNSIGYIASLGERIKNMFNFTVPYLSYLAIVLVVLGAAVLYFIPVRYLILVWGVNKFSRKILRPHTVPNNELLDLLSRVPDDEELLNYRELKPLPTADCEKGGSTASPTGIAARREQRRKHKVA